MSLKESKAEQILGIFFTVLGILLLVVIIPSQIAYVNGAYPQPRFFPDLIAALVSILGISLFVNGRKKKDMDPAEQETYSLQWKEAKLVLITLGLMALYVISLYFVPYLPATMVALAVLIIVYGQRNIFKIVGTSVLVPLIIYVGLTYGLKMRLP